MPDSFSQRLQRRWYAGTPPLLLLPLSWLFGAVVRLRRLAYARGWLKSSHPGVPVIVVGNLTVGGTGKTPVTLWLARELAQRGLTVGIVSRGYGGNARVPRMVKPDSDAREVGDEALLLARYSGADVCVAPERARAAAELVGRGCRIILSDDGLQHLALRRDLEIVVVDGQRRFGNGALLPAGPLREPVSRLKSVDLVLVNGAPVPASATALAVEGAPAPLEFILNPSVAVPLAGGAARPLSSFHGPVHAVAGIGHPARFFASLRQAGLEPVEHAFPDHYAFRASDLEFGDAYPVLMTQKDAVKCTRFADARMWEVPVEPGFAPQVASRILAIVMRCAGGPERA